MKNPNALCTVGILSALLEDGSRDYSDLISPFILAVAARKEEEIVDILDIQKSMKNDYGFEDMPLDFIRGILNRHTGKDKYFRRHHGEYHVSKIFDGQTLANKQQSMREKIDYVIGKMQNYFEVKYIHEKLDYQIIKDMLEHFFQSCGFAMARNVNNLYEISSRSYGKEIFWVARFVLDSIGKHLLEEDYLLEMVKGFLICKALYYFENDNKIGFESKLKNVSCFLDCSLIISILGYNSEERKREALELVHLVKTNGGRVYALEHTVSEAKSLLESFALQQHNANSFQLDGLTSKNFTSEMLFAIAYSVGNNLKEKAGIDTIPNPEYTLSNYSGVQDERAIAAWLEDTRRRVNKGRPYKRDRFDFDARSLSSIGILRKGSHPLTIECCQAILVTQDPFLSSCMKNLHPSRFPPEVDFAILDVDLVSLLWLSSYNAKSSLPIEILISNAVALNLASPEIMERAFELTDQLVKDGDLADDAALLIRSHPRIKRHLGEVTQNDLSAVSYTNIKKTIDKFIEEEASKQIEAAILPYKKEIEAEKKKNRDADEKRLQQRIYCDKKAQQIANKVSGSFENILLITSIAVLIISILVWSLKFSTDYPHFHMGWTYLFAILDILSLLQIIDFFRNQNGFIKRASKKMNGWIYTQCYSYLIGNTEAL